MKSFVIFIQSFGEKFAVLLAGFLGSLMTVIADRSIGWKKALILVPSGAVAAGYLTPLASHFLELDYELMSSLAFLVGLYTMHVVKLLLSLLNVLATQPSRFMEILFRLLRLRR